MKNPEFGPRVNYWRTRRRIPMAEFARLMGKSLRWLEDLEGGRRQADPQYSVMVLAARHLGITVDRLMSETIDTDCARETEVDAVRRALQRHDVITGNFDDGGEEAAPVEDLYRALAFARGGFQAGHFAQLGSEIPDLLVAASRAAHQHEGDDRLRAYEVLSLSLELTEAAAIKWGDAPLALLAGHRAVAAAERSQSPVIMASAARHLGDAMTAHGEAAAAAEFVLAAARRLEQELLRSGPDGYSTLGMLYLKAAMAAAAASEAEDRDPGRFSRRVPDYLDEADEHADRLGGDQDRLWTSFGPTNVDLYRVASHVYLSEGADAVAVAAGIPAGALDRLPRERRAHLLTDRAIGEKQAGQRQQSVQTLLEAEELAPEEVRCRPRTRALVEDLRILGAGSAEGRLRLLADRCGLPG
ncbi:helix-turn-helix domain-containing protein [Streptomyces tendae]|uniref:helix-turn-helix domain-containing protein n=1 Tax=Streptomyces tendae TaxID=1932 RepID=UPI003EBA4C44